MVRFDSSNPGHVTLVVLVALWPLCLITMLVLIIKNKILRKRRQKKLALASGYKALGSDIELGLQPSQNESNGVQQLPTNDEGGEDLDGKPKLEFEGNPVYQLEGEGREQPRAPFELGQAPQDPAPTPERNRSRRLIPSVHIEINSDQERIAVRDV